MVWAKGSVDDDLAFDAMHDEWLGSQEAPDIFEDQEKWEEWAKSTGNPYWTEQVEESY